MRSRIGATIAGVAALGLTAAVVSACGSSSSGGGSGSGTASKPTMELIVGTKSDDFYVSMECGAQREAQKLGVKLTMTGPATFAVPQQKPLIDEAQVTKPGALLVAPTDTAALNPDLVKVQRAGSKIIFVDTSSADPAL